MTDNKDNKKDYIVLGLIGCFLGILSFLLIYGTKILIFTNDGWILNNQMDMRQHYNGWCHFRNTPWMFPIGLIDSLSEPFTMSVVYTDSIPLFAVFFKLFRSVLPVHFQYFGLFGIICYALQGAFSAVLIRIFTKKKFLCIIGSVFFILSFPLLQRMYYHTALGAQWLIILALIFWFSIDLNNIKLSSLAWGILGFICVGIHSYFVFMTGIVLMLSVVEFVIKTKKIKPVIYTLASFCICSFINLYILGGFYGVSSVSGYGFGMFNANITSYINPLENSRILKSIPLYNSFEYEGFAYLGVGIFIVLLTIIVGILIKKITLKSSLRKKIIISGVVFSSFISMFPNFDFGPVKLIHFPVPSALEPLFGVCRTNGRFVWIAYYLILLSVIVVISPYFEKITIKLIFGLALLVQIYDISTMAKTKYSEISKIERFTSVWNQFEGMKLFDGKERFVFLYNDSDIMMDTAFYGYLNNMSQNIYYYARPIDETISENIDKLIQEISKGNIDESAVYVLREEDMTNELWNAFTKNDLTQYYFDNHLVFSKQ